MRALFAHLASVIRFASVKGRIYLHRHQGVSRKNPKKSARFVKYSSQHQQKYPVFCRFHAAGAGYIFLFLRYNRDKMRRGALRRRRAGRGQTAQNSARARSEAIRACGVRCVVWCGAAERGREAKQFERAVCGVRCAVCGVWCVVWCGAKQCAGAVAEN